MSAVDYMNRYLDLAVVLGDDEVQRTSIAKYLNNAVNPRGKTAWDESDLLLSEMIDDTHTNWRATQFTIGGTVILQKTVRKVFTGKGSPREVKSVLWRAHRFGHITNPNKAHRGSRSLREYTDAFCGLDCNGFVGNFLGIDPTTAISEYGARGRRMSNIDEVGEGTTLVWYDPNNSTPYRHIAVVDTVLATGDPLQLKIVQSAGATEDDGVRDLILSKTAQEITRDADNKLSFLGAAPPWTSAATRVYFCSQPGGDNSNE
jgi:hypothetical protein